MKIVADTGPIIGLAKIKKIYLLDYFSDEIFIPPMVYRELFGKIGKESPEIDKALSSIIKTAEPPQIDQNIKSFISDLDEGEKQSIALAHSYLNDVLLLMDDRAGRDAANKLQIPVTGLIGLLLKSKEKGYIDNIETIITELRQEGYWLADDIVRIAIKLSGEL